MYQITKHQCVTQKGMRKIAEYITSFMPRYSVIAISGDLGTGKTFLVRAIMQLLMRREIVVPSPTFTIVNSYIIPSRAYKVHHLDLYRITTTTALHDIGFLELINQDVAIIEWPALAISLCEPESVMSVNIEYASHASRNIVIAMITANINMFDFQI